MAHIDATQVRRGTPEAALASIRPSDGGAMSEATTVDVAETVIGGPPTIGDETDESNGTTGTTGRTPDQG